MAGCIGAPVFHVLDERAQLGQDLRRLRPTHRMCAVGRTIEPRTLDPGTNDASVLPGREVRSGSESAREQVAPIPEFDLRQPITDRGPSLFRDFELDRSPCLFWVTAP